MTSSRETLLLRGAPAADAIPYQRSPQGAPVWGRRTTPPPAEAAAPAVTVAPEPAPVPQQSRPAVPAPAHHLPPAAASAAAGTAKSAGGSRADAAGMRLGDVYADPPARPRGEAPRA